MISELIKDFIGMPTQSETEVRTKFVNPICELLDYPIENRAEEFPVYGHEGGKKISSKSADILLFDSTDFVNNRSRVIEQINWVCEHSLLVVEVKKRGESIEVEGQAIYYAAWTRTPLYVITNGEQIIFYKINSNFSDELILKCGIKDLPEQWDFIYSIFSYANSTSFKATTSCVNKNFENERYSEYYNELLIQLDENLKRMVNRDVNKSSTNYFETVLHNSKNECLDYHKLLDGDKAKVIVSEPGGGKSYLLNILTRDTLAEVQNHTYKSPVIIKCEYFGVLYYNIVEAIYNAVLSFSSNITLDIINNDLKQGKFILMFDALDEVKNNKRLLIEYIKQVITTTGNQVIITERKENYKSEFDVLCDLYEIQPLSEELVAKYIYDNTERKVSIHQLNLDNRFKKMLATPLFLFIVVEVLNNQSPYLSGIPKNKSKLYDIFFNYPLKDKISTVEQGLLEEIFATYAEHLMYYQESNKKLIEIIQTFVGANQCEKYLELINKTGIMVTGINGIKFFHYTFLEYFYAKELTKKNDGEIQVFLEQYADDKNYFEIICFVVGIMSDLNKQNIVLDYLKIHNLPLFVKTLESRFKFEKTAVDAEYDYSDDYFMQVRNTYIELINEYFYNIRSFFFPYSMKFDDNIHKVKLIGKIDYGNLGVSVRFVCTEKNDVDVEFSRLESHPKIYTSKSDVGITMLSLTTSDGGFYVNLQYLSLGIDSAREIALRILKKQLFKFTNEKVVLDNGNKVLMAESVELVLEYLNKRKKFPESLEGLSLLKDSNAVLNFFITNKDKPVIQSIGCDGLKLPFSLLANYCQLLNISGMNIQELLVVKNDLSHKDFISEKESQFMSDLYSDERLCEAIKRVITLTEYSYNELIETKFPKLSKYMSSYKKSLYKIVWIERNGYGGGVSIINIKVNEHQKGIQLILGEERPSYPYLENDIINHALVKLGCTNKDIISSQSSVMHLYMEDNVIHKNVYKMLEEDMKKLLGKI